MTDPEAIAGTVADAVSEDTGRVIDLTVSPPTDTRADTAPGAPVWGTPDSLPASAPDTVADVLGDLPGAEADTDPDTEGEQDPDTEADTEADSGGDAESVSGHGARLGGPVDVEQDLPGEAVWARERKPVIPNWLRSRTAVMGLVRQSVGYAGYVVGFQATRSPKYAVKTAFYGTTGIARLVGRTLWWATAEEGNWGLRQYAAYRNRPEEWLKLDRVRERHTVWRWWVVGAAFVAAIVSALVLTYGPVPVWGQAAAIAGVLVLGARFGRPADTRILDRVTEGDTYRKLTADLVRRGLVSLGIAGITSAVTKDPGAITFPTEIHRDGPGHLAVVDLPYGVEASEVIARRGRLASALRLPLDQVWPEPAPGHTGRLALWVGYQPASAMKQPAWPLAKGGKVDVFKPFPFATTPRLDVVDAELMFRNWLDGGQPGSGKTGALRVKVLAAALDPRVELRVYNLKGTGDFRDLEPICTEYGNGQDDETLTACAGMIDWAYTECQARAKRIDHYARVGKAPENKVTPELAALKGSGLHPLVLVIDEIQELFTHPKLGRDAGIMLEKVIKLGRALGVIILIGTQIPDKDSLPPGITRNVNTRYALSVADQNANDMILGTSAYKNGLRATVFEPVVQAGWGILRGIGKPGAVRAFYLDGPASAAVAARAITARQAAGTLPETPVDRVAETRFDLLADLAQVWPTDQDKAWNETLLGLLAELHPETYTDWKPETLTAALKPHGIEVGQILRRVDGKPVNKRGPARDDITAALTQRNRNRDAG
jgi:S-DNA-T family DNA segregation ATPase FtsK/SpoIIIE